MADWEDTFTERIKTRALQRMRKNAYLIQEDHATIGEVAFKNSNVSSRNFESQNENINPNITPVKPMIAEHLTICKSLDVDKMESNDSLIFPKKNSRKKASAGDPDIKKEKEDVYMKQCKNRLANLAGKLKQFEEENCHISKQAPMKRRSGELKSESANKTLKLETKASKIVTKAHKFVRPVKLIIKKTEPKEILDNSLRQSVVETLESRGYTRTESNAHLFYDFKAANNPKSEKVKTPVRQEKQEMLKLHSNVNYQSNIFVQNTKKNEQKSENLADPCLLSVAERKRLFEERLFDDENISPITSKIFSKSPKIKKRQTKTKYSDTDDSGDEYDTCESEIDSNVDLAEENENSPIINECEQSDNSEVDCNERSGKDSDISAYPILKTIEQIEVSSTPKPDRLYPSVSDIESETDEDLHMLEESVKGTTNINDNFENELLSATNHILSSYCENKTTPSSNVKKTKINALLEAKNLISSSEDYSPSVSTPDARSSIISVECDNETASFTYAKNYPNHSIMISDPTSVEQEIDDCYSRIDGDLVIDRMIKLLEEEVVKEKTKLAQAINALRLCLSTSFLNSTSHLEAEKLVLLSQLKIEAVQNEISRIRKENSITPNGVVSSSIHGDVVLSKIKLPIKMPTVQSDLRGSLYNNLMCVIKCRAAVLATEIVSVASNNIKHDTDGVYIEFSNTIVIPNVSSDFKIIMEVYNLVIEKMDEMNSRNGQYFKKDKKTPIKKCKNQAMMEHRKVEKNPHSAFVMVGNLIFSQSEMEHFQWILNKQDFRHSPLVGIILMQLKSNLVKVTIQKRGFLTMYEVVSDFGAWSRNWFFLDGDKLSFWKYPEQEITQEPVGIFDLKKCITKEVTTVGYDVVFRPQTFMLHFDPPTYLQQFKGLKENRLLLSADNEEDRILWCENLQKVLTSIRSWSNSEK